MWSTHTYMASLLDAYAGPTPVVADYVRQQLMTTDEEDEIKGAIFDVFEGETHSASPYFALILRSGLQGSDVDRVVEPALIEALFDLRLGQRLKAFRLNHCTEIHEARALVRHFFDQFFDCISPTINPDDLWWDGIEDSDGTPNQRWISMRLREDVDFFPIFERWLSDGEHLQTWFDDMVAETLIMNNPNCQNPVFSEAAAVEVLRWAKVGIPDIGRFKSASNVFPVPERCP